MADLQPRHIFRLSATDAQLRYAMRRAIVFVYPSLYEGFGMPILEAMRQNCPMALANASYFPEIARDAAVYFDPYDAESMASVMEDLILNSQKQTTLVKLASKLVADYSIERMIRGTIDTYSAVASH